MHTAEAAARLFAHALNPLAHAEEGLDGAVAIATRCPCFALHTADLPATCALMVRTLHDQFQSAQNGIVCTTPQI
jgi:hypothetical protein